MAEKSLHDLAADLVNPEREFPVSTPHSYAHEVGAKVLRRFHLVPSQEPQEPLGSNVVLLYPDLPETTVYYFPPRGEGA